MQSDSTPPRRRLTDILTGGADALRATWDATKPAEVFKALPSGSYECHVHDLKLFTARTGTPGVKIRFDVCNGTHAGRAVFHDCWLTPAALPRAKRDLLALGYTSLDELESRVIPPGRLRCEVRVTKRRSDDGAEWNHVASFKFLGYDEPEPDAFAPADDGGGDDAFDFGANVPPSEEADDDRG